MILQLEVDDGVLEDFYLAIGANAPAEWSAEEVAQWRQVMFLEPYLNDTMLREAIMHRERAAVRDAVKTARVASDVVQQEAEVAQRAREDALPEKLRPVRAPEPAPPTGER